MAVDQDSERSMLERKERADLVAMATALGEKPPARAKKADVVELILRLTNVGTPAAPPPPSRGRARAGEGAGPAADETLVEHEAVLSDEAVFSDEAVVAGSADLPAEGDTAGDREDEAAAGGQLVFDDDDGREDDDRGDVSGAATASAAPGDEAAGADGEQRSADATSEPGAGPSTPATEQGEGRQNEAATAGAAPAGMAGRGPDRSARDGQGTNRRTFAPDDHAGPTAGNRNDQVGSRRDSPPQNRRPQGAVDASQGGQGRSGQVNRPGSGGNGAQGANGDREQGDRGDQPDHANRTDGDHQGGQANQDGSRFDDGEGNRRRRRRGRERDRPGGEQQDEAFAGEPVDVEGLLDLRDEGYGFLRLKGYLPSKDDVYVSVKQARQFALRKGDRLKGKARPASRNEKNPALLRVDAVNDVDPADARQRARFEDLTPLFPDARLHLERPDDPSNMTARIVDLIAPIGKGQRGLIVSPPKAGKTTVMKQIARSIETNDPDVELIVLLVDERPEEVTDMRRWLKRGEVAASTFDRPSEEHTQVAELVIERAKRMVEDGKDVVIILDGITRLARAYNLAAPATGRVMSGGIDTGALYPPKKFFGAARNVEEGGSLTILASALVETGSRMDEVIFEEFKGTGNMELKLDRRLADRRIYPAIDVDASSTRHEELLFERKQLQQVWRLRRVLSGLGGEGASNAASLELLIDRMKTFKNNDEFLAEVAKVPAGT